MIPDQDNILAACKYALQFYTLHKSLAIRLKTLAEKLIQATTCVSRTSGAFTEDNTLLLAIRL